MSAAARAFHKTPPMTYKKPTVAVGFVDEIATITLLLAS